MKISTRARYALRAMVDLAMHCDGRPVPRRDIARRQGISAHYLEQLLIKLRDAGYIEPVRGPGGGYVLCRSPDDIQVGELIQTVEEVLGPVPCLAAKSATECNRAATCVTRRVWKELGRRTYEFLESITLQDLCDEARELSARAA